MTEQEKMQELFQKQGGWALVTLPFILAWIMGSNAFVIMKIWNWFAPPVFSEIGFQANPISYGAALGLWIVLSLLAFPVMYFLSTLKFESKEPGEIASICFLGPFVTLFVMWLLHFLFEWMLRTF